MATIFPDGLRVLGGPTTFTWLDYRIAGSGPNSPNVYLTGRQGQYTGLAGGEQFTLSRGSTAQFSVVVTVAAPGGGPGTKTLAELVADINGVFGIAAGKPTDFAFAWKNSVRLVDNTVGLNTAYAEVVDYAGANEAAKNALFEKVGLPARFIRDITSPGSSSRDCGLEPTRQNDDASCISSNYLTLPANAKALWIRAQAGTLGDINTISPIFSFFFSDGAGLEPPIGIKYLSELPGLENVFNPAPAFGTVMLGGGSTALTVPQNPQGIFALPGPPIFFPTFTTTTDFKVEVPQWAPARVRCVAVGSLQTTPQTTRFCARLGMTAWVLG